MSSEDSKRKNKAPIKNEVGSYENEEVKLPSRQSKRNMNKVITYKDEDLSEDEAYPKRGGKNVKKAKNDDSDVSNEDNEDHSGGEIKAKNQSVTKKKSRASDIDDEQDADGCFSEEESKTKKSKKKKDVPSLAKKPKIDKPPLNKTQSDYGSLDFSNDRTTSDGKLWNLKISSWNVGGLKAWVKVRFYRQFLIGIRYILVKQMDRSEETITKL